MNDETKILCPIIGCGSVHVGKQAIIEHFKKEHSDVEKINIGGERINLKS